MRMLDKLVCWMAPSRDDEIAAAEAGAKAARARLQYVTSRDPDVAQTVKAHQLDRIQNHYGDRIMHALRGDFL